jgi:hypothetical protein
MTCQSKAMHGKARHNMHGMACQGKEMHGKAWHVKARHGPMPNGIIQMSNY